MIDSDVLDRVLNEARCRGAGFAEVYAEDRRNTGVAFDDGRIDGVSSGRDRGAGVRVINGVTTGYAHTSDLSERGLLAAARAAADAAGSGAGGVVTVALDGCTRGAGTRVVVDPNSVSKARRVEMLTEVDEIARSVNGAVTQVSAGLSDSYRSVLIANSDGVYVTDEVTRVLFRVSVVADGDLGMQTGAESLGFTGGWEVFDRYALTDLATEAAEQAVRKLRARPAPSGQLPVVIAQGTGGVLFHEACGHGLEADHIAKAASVYAGRLGELVASPLVTLVDDGTIDGEWGTRSFDDEGQATRRNVLIENGVLVDYMWDHIRARDEQRAPSGNGRRQDYASLPMVRMTNTFVLAGEDDPADIISSTEHGVYVAKLGGGSVNTASGDFVFGMRDAYLIENGQITEPLREGNLIGNGPQVLSDIDMLGNDFAMGGPGTCGKDGQGVPVGTGQPTLRVSSMTIGGTAA